MDSLSAAELIKALADERAAILSREAVSACPANPGQESAPGNPGLATIADIGSGGGLPGIPLAAALPQYNFVLVERMSKRCAFLENAAAILGLRNAQVKNLELEKTPAASFDIATFRAFRPLDDKMLKSLLAVLKPGGVLAAYKARRQKILEEMGALGYAEQAATGDASSDLGAANNSRVYKSVALEVPFLTDTNNGDDRERNLVLIPKN